MYHFCCCAQYFVALAFSSAFFVFFVVTLCPCNILMAFIIFDKSSCIMFALLPLGLSKKIVKRSLWNSRRAIGIRDAENLEKGYMAHAVPLVFGANFFLKSTNISLCAMSRLDLVNFWFSVGCRCAIGFVTKWCDFPPCDVTFLHLAFPLGDVTFLRLMWLKPGASSILQLLLALCWILSWTKGLSWFHVSIW